MFNLNCVPGDLAIVVKGPDAWLGRIVECEHYVGQMDILPLPKEASNNLWKVNVELPYHYSNLGREVKLFYCPDEYLKPLRFSDGEDEMLKIAGKPVEKASA